MIQSAATFPSPQLAEMVSSLKEMVTALVGK